MFRFSSYIFKEDRRKSSTQPDCLLCSIQYHCHLHNKLKFILFVMKNSDMCVISPETLLYNCGVCLEYHAKMILLRCGHMMCQNCTLQIFHTTDLDIGLMCPFCKKTHKHYYFVDDPIDSLKYADEETVAEFPLRPKLSENEIVSLYFCRRTVRPKTIHLVITAGTQLPNEMKKMYSCIIKMFSPQIRFYPIEK